MTSALTIAWGSQESAQWPSWKRLTSSACVSLPDISSVFTCLLCTLRVRGIEPPWNWKEIKRPGGMAHGGRPAMTARDVHTLASARRRYEN